MESGEWLAVLVVIGARLAVPLFIPKYPLPAALLTLVIDGIDKGVFQILTSMNLDWYQSYDKALDVYYLSIEYLSTLRNWANLYAFQMGRFLYYFRLLGTLLFELSQVRALLLLFPNTFEYFFLFYEGVRLRWNPRRLSLAVVIGAAFAIWVFIKIPQEYWIHIAQLDATDTIKQYLFGMPVDAAWGAVFRQNVPLVAALLIALGLGLGVAWWFIDRKLPPADWRLAFNADAHDSDVTEAELVAARRIIAERFFTGELFEKTVLVSMVTIIFWRMLPGVDASIVQIAAGVASVILANTLVSELLVRRGVRWQSIPREFFVMGLVNAALVALFSATLPWMGGALDVPATYFSVLLLTLLVTLYDRFRPYQEARFARVREAEHQPVQVA